MEKGIEYLNQSNHWIVGVLMADDSVMWYLKSQKGKRFVLDGDVL